MTNEMETNPAILVYQLAEKLIGDPNDPGYLFLERVFKHVADQERKDLIIWLHERRRGTVEAMMRSTLTLAEFER